MDGGTLVSDAGVAEVATAEVSTLRQRLWKVGAVVKASARRIWFHLSARWPYRGGLRVQTALQQFVAAVRQARQTFWPGVAAACPG